MTEFIDDGHCFVCGPKNPIGLKLDFSFDGKSVKTTFVPGREHQGYANIVHGGIIATLLDEVMVKLAIELGVPAVTAQMDIRLRSTVKVGEKITVSATIIEKYRILLNAYASAVLEDGSIAAEATAKLVKIKLKTNTSR